MLVCPEQGPAPGTPRSGPQRFGGRGRSGVDSVGLKVPRGRAPKVPEKAGGVGLAFIRTRPQVPPRGPQGGTSMFGGSGQVGVDSVDLGVPQDFIKSVTHCVQNTQNDRFNLQKCRVGVKKTNA